MEELDASSSSRKGFKRGLNIRHLESLDNCFLRFSHMNQTGGVINFVPGRALVKDVWGDEDAAMLIVHLGAAKNRDLVKLGNLPRPQPTQTSFVVFRDDTMAENLCRNSAGLLISTPGTPAKW